jgi:radical SAM superfamily enzyme YgiQ (UPF0313 family)
MLLLIPEYRLWFKFPPLGALCIGAVLKRAGEPVELLDGGVEALSPARLRAALARHATVGISANVAHLYSGVRLARFIRREFPGHRILWGGPAPSEQYADLLPELADAVVIGEGETQAVKFAAGMPLAEIPGVAWWDGQAIRVNPRQPFIEDLDALPFPAWELVAGKRYAVPGRQPLHMIVTERGCPFHCLNCTKIIHGDRYRARSVASVVDEIEHLHRHFGSRDIHVFDDNFTLDPARVKAICREIVARGLHRHLRLALPNGIRADIRDEEMFDLMRQAGFYFVNVAVESGDQAVIAQLGKELDLAQVPRTVEMLVAKGFRVGVLFMMGLPFDTPETLRKTARLAAALPAHHAYISIVTPFPGTGLHELARAEGEVVPYEQERGLSFDRTGSRFPSGRLSDAEIRRHLRAAYWRFYMSPRRIWRLIRTILCQGAWASDAAFMIRCGLRILIAGHR